jgi:hypothetical protein
MQTWSDREETAAVKLLEHPIRVKAFDLLMAERLTRAGVGRRLGSRETVTAYHCIRLVRGGVLEMADDEILRPTPLGLYAREWT